MYGTNEMVLLASNVFPTSSQRPHVAVVPRRATALILLSPIVRICARQPLAHLFLRVRVPPVRVQPTVEVAARLMRELLARALVCALLCVLQLAAQGPAVERLVD